MACHYRYQEMINNTKQVLETVRHNIFDKKMELGAIRESSVRRDYPAPTDMSRCCEITRDELIDIEVELYLAQYELDAYNALLFRSNPRLLAERRNAALAAYAREYESRVELNESFGFDEVDATEPSLPDAVSTIEFDEVDMAEKGVSLPDAVKSVATIEFVNE